MGTKGLISQIDKMLIAPVLVLDKRSICKVSRQYELNQGVLSFSVSYGQEAVRIYGHYPVIDGDQTSVHRFPIKKFDITNGGV